MRKEVGIIATFLILLLAGCKPSLPKGVMDQGDMTDFIYDYHIMMAAAQNRYSHDSINYYKTLYFNSLLERYDITKEEYDSTMAYYERHAYLLRDVYTDVVKRIEKETGALGMEQIDEAAYMQFSSEGDTALIWHHPTAELLYGQAPLNIYSFHIETDSTTLPGDCFELNFQTQFLVQEGIRNVRAYLVAVFENDSAITTNNTAGGNRFTKLTLKPNLHDSLRVKALKGFIMFEQRRNTTNAGVRVVSLSYLGLIRYHQQEQLKRELEEQKRIDSLKTANAKDTLKNVKKDSLKEVDNKGSIDKPTVIDKPAVIGKKPTGVKRPGVLEGPQNIKDDRYDPAERQKKNQEKGRKLHEIRTKRNIQEQKIQK